VNAWLEVRVRHRFLICAVSAVLVIGPVLADTNTTSNLTVNPSNSLSVNPATYQNATTANVSQQINNQNLGANGFGGGVVCQSPQIAIGGFGSRQTTGMGLPYSNTGITIEYLAPVGRDSGKSCSEVAREILKARRLDNSLTVIQRCTEFARTGVVLDPAIYPELARSCSGVHVAVAAPPPAEVSTGASTRDVQTAMAAAPARAIHFSDFSPEHNSELRRIAMHRLQRLASLEAEPPPAPGAHRSPLVAERISHENEHLRAILAEYALENRTLHRLLQAQGLQAHNPLRDHILSYNDR
jgi:hypothetical protein